MKGIHSDIEHEITIEEGCYLIQGLVTTLTELAITKETQCRQ